MEIQYLNVQELSERLNVAPITIRKMVMRKELPVTRIGRRVVFSCDLIEQWLKDHTVLPRVE